MSSTNKRIAVNTMYMYARLFVTMLLGLYTSRIVLLVLGISDYGLYNVVAGVLIMFTFISGSLSGATSRFFNVELGKKNGDVNRCFNINLTLHIGLATVVFILSETIGLWYVTNKLNVTEKQLSDVFFVYQLSIFTSCWGIINNPYQSLLGAFERFKFMALFDIVNIFIRLGLVIMMQHYQGNSLRFYTVSMTITSIAPYIAYHWYAFRYWPSIIKLRIIRKWSLYRDVLSFSNWNLFSSLSLAVRSTGSTLLINYFFGTVVNGAFALSNTVNTYLTTFSTNFDSASGPQIIQSYTKQDFSRANYLVYKLGRFCLLLFELFFFPLYIELNFILTIWLKDVPAGVLIFCKLNLLLAAVALTCGGLVQAINASGKIKWFKLTGGILFIICIPIGYVVYLLGMPSYSIIIVFILSDIIQRIIQLILMKRILNFDSVCYIKQAYTRPLIIAIIMSAFLWIHSFVHTYTPIEKIISIILCFFTTSWLVYKIGLTKNEKSKVFTAILSKLKSA